MRQGSCGRTRHGHERVAGSGQIRAADSMKVPKEGTLLRAAYDRLMANPGKPIPWVLTKKKGHNELIQLRDYYGLDIQKTKNHGERWLAGMYDASGNYTKFERKTT